MASATPTIPSESSPMSQSPFTSPESNSSTYPTDMVANAVLVDAAGSLPVDESSDHPVDIPLGPVDDVSERYMPITPDQALQGVQRLPKELREMIYAFVVNRPRLLVWRDEGLHQYDKVNNVSRVNDRALFGWISQTSRLPPFFFLNNEAYKEVMRHINLIPQAKDDKAIRYPGSYINPKYDTLYWKWWFDADPPVPSTEQIPGIQTLARKVTTPFKCRHQVGSMARFTQDIVTYIQKFPDAKELILVRPLDILESARKKGGNDYIFMDPADRKEMKDEHVGRIVPRIEKHPCGFFGAINEEIENILAALPNPIWDVDPPPPYNKSSKDALDSVTRQLTTIYAEKHPGTKPPLISAAYNFWVDADGLWQCV